VPSLGWRIRAGALTAVGALGVHDLRYLLAYHGRAGQELALQGHSYLRLATPLVCGLLVLAAAAFAGRLLRAYAGHGDEGEPRALPSTRRMWALASALLIGVYSAQEWIEGQLAADHAGGLAAPFSHGGWLALPLALVIGLLIALALRGAATAIAVAAGRGRARVAPPSPCQLASPVARSVWSAPPQGALARRLSPRAPPAFV
jgi:hypothetical protein